MRIGFTAAVFSVCLLAADIPAVTKQPSAKLAVTLGFRDWGPSTVDGSAILAGNQTGVGGLFAVDAGTGKLKWRFIPKFHGTASVSTGPAVAGNVVITPFATGTPGAVIAVALDTGRELWRGPDPAQDSAVAVADGLAYIAGRNGTMYALETATGRERWKVELASDRAPCYSRPIVAAGTLYFTGIGPNHPKDVTRRPSYYLFAFDAATGAERWRYRAEAPYIHPGVCLTQPVLAGDTLYATGESRVYAIDKNTGRDRWSPVEVQRMQEGRIRPVPLSQAAAAGVHVLVAAPGQLIALQADSGRLAWELPGAYDPSRASLVIASNVLYFQGSPASQPAARSTGTLCALDLDTQKILWSFTHVSPNPAWSFGSVTPVNGAIWVDTYKTLLKLE